MPDSYSIEPTGQDAWRLIGHFLHHRCHFDPDWRRIDHRASQLREELAMLPVARGQDVTLCGSFISVRCPVVKALQSVFGRPLPGE